MFASGTVEDLARGALLDFDTCSSYGDSGESGEWWSGESEHVAEISVEPSFQHKQKLPFKVYKLLHEKYLIIVHLSVSVLCCTLKVDRAITLQMFHI